MGKDCIPYGDYIKDLKEGQVDLSSEDIEGIKKGIYTELIEKDKPNVEVYITQLHKYASYYLNSIVVPEKKSKAFKKWAMENNFRLSPITDGNEVELKSWSLELL